MKMILHSSGFYIADYWETGYNWSDENIEVWVIS